MTIRVNQKMKAHAFIGSTYRGGYASLIIFICMGNSHKSHQYNFGLINFTFNRTTIVNRNRGGGGVLANIGCALFIGVAQNYFNTKFKVEKNG